MGGLDRETTSGNAARARVVIVIVISRRCIRGSASVGGLLCARGRQHVTIPVYLEGEALVVVVVVRDDGVWKGYLVPCVRADLHSMETCRQRQSTSGTHEPEPAPLAGV